MRGQLLLCFLFFSQWTFAQQPSESPLYDEAYLLLSQMLSGEREATFSDAVFITENAYLRPPRRAHRA